jgi:hypothetical protein
MTRWIDQGAGQALPVLEVATRRVSGLIEAAMARHVSDRTDWRALLRGTAESLDLPAARDRLISECREDVDRIIDEFGDDAVRQLPQAKTVQIEFPVLDYPEKIRSLNFDRSPEIEGRLRGIKGQYLILDTGVLNVRKFRSYVVSVDA